MKTIVLISCCKKKLNCKAPAEFFYQSPVFKKSLAYAKSLNTSDIFVLSAKHHLVSLSDELYPYDVCLKDFSSFDRRKWGIEVINQLKMVSDLDNDEFIIIAGKNYYSEIIKSINHYKLPLKGLTLGMRLKKLDEFIDYKITNSFPKEHTVKTAHELSSRKNILPCSSLENNYENLCMELHNFFNKLERFTFSFDDSKIPKNGVYVFFEKGEVYHGLDRIVRIGTHRGDGNLPARLKQHLINANKDRSIFRKNIGRAFLNKDNDSFLEQWNWDLTARKNKDKYSPLLNIQKQKIVEGRVTEYMQKNLSFSVIEIEEMEERFKCEAFLIKALSKTKDFKPSNNWLGLFSPINKIKESGLWLVNELSLERSSN